jgi:hypothetical protein
MTFGYSNSLGRKVVDGEKTDVEQHHQKNWQPHHTSLARKSLSTTPSWAMTGHRQTQPKPYLRSWLNRENSLANVVKSATACKDMTNLRPSSKRSERCDGKIYVSQRALVNVLPTVLVTIIWSFLPSPASAAPTAEVAKQCIHYSYLIYPFKRPGAVRMSGDRQAYIKDCMEKEGKVPAPAMTH